MTLHSKRDLVVKTSFCMALGISKPVKRSVLEGTTECLVFTAVFYIVRTWEYLESNRVLIQVAVISVASIVWLTICWTLGKDMVLAIACTLTFVSPNK